MPELFDAMVAHPAGAGMKEDPGQFPVPKAVIESFESLEFLDDLVRHPPPPADREDLERLREQAQHALRLKAALEGADRFGVGVGFLGPLAGGTLLQEDQWADEFIALLHYVVEGQLGVVNVCMSHHSGGLPAAAPGENVLRPLGQAAHHGSPRREEHVSPSGAGQAVMKTIGVARGPMVARRATGRERYRPGGLTPPGHTEERNACAGAPPHAAIELAMDLIAVGEGLGTQRARRARLEVDVLRGAQGLQDGIKTLPRPGEPLAQLMDGDAIGVRGKALIGSLELLPEAMGLDEPGALLVVIKPGTQGFPARGVARGGALSCRGLPIEHAIEALEEVGRQADTDDPRLVLGVFGHGFPLLLKNHYKM